jgi:hypothetical protein
MQTRRKFSPTWDTNRQKKQICKSANREKKRQKNCRLEDLQLTDLEICDTLIDRIVGFLRKVK